MNIPDEVMEAGWAASYAEATMSGAPLAFMRVVAEWARREALREAAEDYGTPGMTATTQYVKEWLRDRADRVGEDKTDD